MYVLYNILDFSKHVKLDNVWNYLNETINKKYMYACMYLHICSYY